MEVIQWEKYRDQLNELDDRFTKVPEVEVKGSRIKWMLKKAACTTFLFFTRCPKVPFFCVLCFPIFFGKKSLLAFHLALCLDGQRETAIFREKQAQWLEDWRIAQEKDLAKLHDQLKAMISSVEALHKGLQPSAWWYALPDEIDVNRDCKLAEGASCKVFEGIFRQSPVAVKVRS